MRGSFSILHLLFFFFLLVFLYVFIQVGILSIVLDKLGLSPNSAAMLFLGTLIGSTINLPLFTLKHSKQPLNELPPVPPWIPGKSLPFHNKTIIAINVGGALIPMTFSLYLVMISNLSLLDVLTAISAVSFVSYIFSQPIPGLGIGMPILIAPLTAAFMSLFISPEQASPLAYISGTLGVLIGADLLRLKDIKQLSTPFASIGGAGTFDGIFFSGIIAVLLT
ncbi:MAG: DUF1614 domain-containing protein [Gammaproteobacteria bacterium]|nr:DUF1614 domain-containing protein [Gammaproteobacteria bacterium]